MKGKNVPQPPLPPLAEPAPEFPGNPSSLPAAGPPLTPSEFADLGNALLRFTDEDARAAALLAERALAKNRKAGLTLRQSIHSISCGCAIQNPGRFIGRDAVGRLFILAQPGYRLLAVLEAAVKKLRLPAKAERINTFALFPPLPPDIAERHPEIVLEPGFDPENLSSEQSLLMLHAKQHCLRAAAYESFIEARPTPAELQAAEAFFASSSKTNIPATPQLSQAGAALICLCRSNTPCGEAALTWLLLHREHGFHNSATLPIIEAAHSIAESRLLLSQAPGGAHKGGAPRI